jgi:hypothetical protein
MLNPLGSIMTTSLSKAKCASIIPAESFNMGYWTKGIGNLLYEGKIKVHTRTGGGV